MSEDTVVESPKKATGRPERKEEVKEERRRRGRSGLDRHLRLTVSDEWKDHWKDYELRWVNDDRGKLQQRTERDDWDICHRHELPSAEPLGDGEGTPIKQTVGIGADGRPMQAYLCRKRKEYYKADKDAEQKAIKDQEDAVLNYKAAAGGQQGLNPSAPEDNAYVPSGRR